MLLSPLTWCCVRRDIQAWIDQIASDQIRSDQIVLELLYLDRVLLYGALRLVWTYARGIERGKREEAGRVKGW